MKSIQSTVTVHDQMPGREIDYTISAKNSGLIMKSLAGLYSNSARATIREYSTNAFDSHIESGHRDPIDVTLPSSLHPYFTVKDHGTGMDCATLEEVYTSFGESTRRESDDYNGSWGYGCKAALAYTNSFTITAVKDGLMNVGVVTRKDTGAMTLKLVLEDVATNEPNGVEIQVPVHDIDEFNREAELFYSYWATGTVSINGTNNQNKFTQAELLHTDMYENVGSSDCYVVMGNVAYKIENPRSLFPTDKAFVAFIAYVPNRTVQFTPAREALDYTEYTRKALQALVDNYLATVMARAEKEVKGAKTKWEALSASRKWNRILGKSFKYKGKEIPTRIEFTTQGKYGPDSQPLWHVNRHWQPVTRTNEIDLESTPLIIIGATSTVGSYQRDRLKQWWASTGRTRPSYVYFTREEKWTNVWIDPKNIVSWEQVKAETPPAKRASAAGTRVKGSFDVLKPDGTWEAHVQPTDPKFWVEHSYAKDANWKVIAPAFNITDDVVIVPANRETKFFRDYPGTQNVRKFQESQVDLDGDGLYTREQRLFFSLPYYEKQMLVKLDASKVDDPALAEVITLSQRKDITKPADYATNQSRADMLHLPFKRFVNLEEEIRKVTVGAYPLIDWNHNRYYNSGHDFAHYYVYVNAVYAARKDGTLE